MENILYLVAIALVLWAQFAVKGKYSHFSTVQTRKHLSGADVARGILHSKGLNDVQVLMSKDMILSDHFDPKTNTVHLSAKVFSESSIASVAIAAHEVGHAIQYAEQYGFISIRNALLPLTIVSGHLGMIVAVIGLITSSTSLFTVGLVMISIIALFQTITLPIEFDASNRALTILSEDGYLDQDEIADSKSMLSAAAMTYVAALLATLMQIVRLVMLSNRRRN